MTESKITPESGQSDITPAPPARQWRVGTISMGLSLVALGTVLLMGRFNASFTIAGLLKFWPLVLIVLGLEMVLFNVLTSFKGGRIRFSYDILSIFLVLLMLFVSSGLVALESTGVLKLAERALQISQRYTQADKVQYTVDDSLDTLVLGIDEGTTNLRTYSGNEVRVTVVYNGYFASRAEASQYAEEQLVSSERMGDTLFVQVYPPSRAQLPSNYVSQEVTVLIPNNLNVELEQARGGVSISLEDLQSNWVVNHRDSHQPLEVVLEEISDARLRVELANNGRLRGNVVWDSEIEHEPPEEIFEAEKIWGEGSYVLILRQSGGTVEVNTR